MTHPIAAWHELTDLKVMVRSLKAVNMMHQHMAAMLEKFSKPL